MTDCISKFIEDSNRAVNPEQVFQLFEASLQDFGIDRICYSLMTDHPSLGQLEGHGVLRNYPDDWMKHYLHSGYTDLDPVRTYVVTARGPFTWDTLIQAKPLLAKELKVMNEAKDAMLFDGLAVPLYGPRGEIAGVGMASSSGGTHLTKDDIMKVNAICNQFYLVYGELESSKPVTENPVRLTRREKEILLWLARGKSLGVIADIIRLSEDGTNFHVRNIFHKLNVSSKVLAVVKAIRLGLVCP